MSQQELTTQTDAPKQDLTQVIAYLDEVKKALGGYTNKALVNIFADAKPLEKKLEEIIQGARAKFIERLEEGGEDDQGNRYFASDYGGVKVETRVKIKLKDDALDRLIAAGAKNVLPTKLNEAKVERIMSEHGVDPSEYRDPYIDAKTLESLEEDEKVDQDTAHDCVDDRSITYVVKPVAANKANAALKEGDG